MPHSIVCLLPMEMGGYDSFLFQESHPEPCCLTLEEFQYPDERIPRRRIRPQQVLTDEPRRWVDILFEPGDILEFRLRPPRAVVNAKQPRQFLETRTAMQHGVYCWTFADEIEVVINKLVALNQGEATWWGVKDRLLDKWAEISGEPGIPLNIYASANPRFFTGGKKDEDVLLARSLFADMEEITVEDALAKAAAAGLPRPTMIVVSGRGVHLYWRLDEAITDLARWTALQKRLIQLLGSDKAIHDPSRVMRVPGFMNVNGSQPAPCYIHDADAGRRYSLDDILPLLPPEPLKPIKPIIPATKSTIIQADNLSVHGKGNTAIHRAEAYASRFQPVEENRNSTAFRRSCALVEKFDLDAEQVLPLIEKANDKADDPLDATELEEVVVKAVRHVKRKGRPRGTALTEEYPVKKYREPTGPVVKLEDWREQMAKARLDNLDQTGKIFFDGSTTGAGKTTADIVAMQKAGRSAVILPTHDACNEHVNKLTEAGLSAAAHPPLNSDTCLEFGTKSKPGRAQLALKAGLNVGQCVCTGCDKSHICEYQKRRELARTADHTVSTHARASLSDFQPAVDKPVVFIHEDVVDLLRPMVKVVGYSKKQDDPQARHLEDILRIAKAAEDIARSWQDAAAIAFATRLKDATNDLIGELNAPELVKALEEAASKGTPTHGLSSVKPFRSGPKPPDMNASTTCSTGRWPKSTSGRTARP